MNQLSNETSPYLKQHSSNPVDWRPWSQAALEEAKAKDRLVLLSVGYSTCHWCHVMKRESFENSQVAEVMNALYVPIKVDREERPDIDSVYMLATQFLTGQGGWPMTVWLTPDLKPIYAGTYFPTFDGDRGVRFGFYSLLSKIAEEYQENREQVLASAENVSNYLLDHFPSAAGETLPDRSTCLERLLPSYDEINGGTNGSPKFPSSLPLELLLTGGERHRAHALKTLDAICSSGIYDHVGGGLHRYAVDAEWNVPHFEKMLYDNALLLRHMHQADSSRYQHFIRETTEFLFRELRDSDTGLFYSAIDAESDDPTGGSAEGYYYTWTNEELSQLLSDKEVCELSLVEFEERNIIVNCKREYKEKLLNVRSSRAYPFVDKKVICSWNSLLVDALAPIETDKAKKTLDALFQYLVEDGELYRVASKELAHFEDYAYLVRACISVYQHSKEECYLSHAMRLSKELEEFFLSDNGGFYSSRQSPDSPPFREISCFDNSLPSGNGIHCLNLLKLFALTRENNYQDRALGVLLAFSEELEKFPQASGALSLAFHVYKKDIASVRSGDVELWETARSFAGPFNVFTFDESVRGAEVCYSDRCILSTTSSTELAECLRSI